MVAGIEPDGQRFRSADKYCLFTPQEAPAILAHARTVRGGEAAITA
jgi:hypothetical protein